MRTEPLGTRAMPRAHHFRGPTVTINLKPKKLGHKLPRKNCNCSGAPGSRSGPLGEGQNAEDALSADKNLFFRGPFHNPLLIIINKKYDMAHILLFFFSYLKEFFFWSDGGPLAGGGPRHVPIVPRP